MLQVTEENTIIKNQSQLIEPFYSGFKTKQTIGLELEKVAAYNDSHLAVSYQDILKVLKSFNDDIWSRYYENDQLLGLKSKYGSISLEPGSQIELSLEPYENLKDIEQLLLYYNNHLNSVSEELNIKFLNLGIQPKSTYDYIIIIPKERYRAMTSYLPSKGEHALVMMRETAGVQVNFDYETEKDAIRKFALALKLSPIISTIYANSPIRNSKLNGYKSCRAKSWLNTDNDRCGLVSKKIFENPDQYSFEDYVETLLDVPMVLIERDFKTIHTSTTFRKFLKSGYQGLQATINDWYTHLSLYFPDVRLKNYIEIRNHDSQKNNLVMSIPALWKGILYDKESMLRCEKLLQDLTYQDYENIRQNTPQTGLTYPDILNIAKEILDISYVSLKKLNNNDEKYLKPIMNLLNEGKVPADILIDKLQNEHKGKVDFLLQSDYITS